MMDKDKLRRADIFSGALICAAGAFIVSQAVQMPMKDSWGGVQNVWYVSPAIFPLFVGTIIMLLGGFLVRTALKEIGMKAFTEIIAFLFSAECLHFLKATKNIRFYAVTAVLLSFVFLFTPRVDFFLAAIDFLLVLICMFYLDDDHLLNTLFIFYAVQILVFILFWSTGTNAYLSDYMAFPGDILTLFFILVFGVYVGHLCRGNARLKKKFKTSVIVAVVAPVFIGMIFKYLLLVPMPFEGLVVQVMDFIWYY